MKNDKKDKDAKQKAKTPTIKPKVKATKKAPVSKKSPTKSPAKTTSKQTPQKSPAANKTNISEKPPLKSNREELVGIWRTGKDAEKNEDKFSTHISSQKEERLVANKANSSPSLSNQKLSSIEYTPLNISRSVHKEGHSLAVPNRTNKQTVMITAYLEGIKKHSEQSTTPSSVLTPQNSVRNMVNSNAESARLEAAKIERSRAESATHEANRAAAAIAERESKMTSSKNEEAKINKQADKVAADKAAADKVAAGKVAADKAAADKVAADKVAADKIAADKIAADKIAADKVAADKVAADKVAADKVAADKVAADKIKMTKQVTGVSVENNQIENEAEDEVEDPLFEQARDEIGSTRHDSVLSQQYAKAEEQRHIEEQKNETADKSSILEKVNVASLGSGVIKLVGSGVSSVTNVGKYAVLGVKYGIADSLELGKDSVTFVQNKIKTAVKGRATVKEKQKSEKVTVIDEIPVESLGSGVINVFGNGIKQVVNAGKYTALGVKYVVTDSLGAGKSTINYFGNIIKKKKTADSA